MVKVSRRECFAVVGLSQLLEDIHRLARGSCTPKILGRRHDYSDTFFACVNGATGSLSP